MIEEDLDHEAGGQSRLRHSNSGQIAPHVKHGKSFQNISHIGEDIDIYMDHQYPAGRPSALMGQIAPHVNYSKSFKNISCW
jgi:hypothetical protein